MNSLFTTLTHFQALVLFALVASVTFGFLSKHGALERTKYVAWAFVMFLLVAIGIGWLMYPFSH